MEKGLIQIYTGNGKGKTTAAVGLSVRAIGRGFNVYMIQFLKDRDTGELHTLSHFDNFKVFRFKSSRKFFWQMNDEEKDLLKKQLKEAYEFIVDVLKNNKCDLLILDEIMGVLHNNLYSIDDIIKLMDMKPEGMEMVMTGRNAPEELIERADLVTEMKLIKHPYEKGIKSRCGIEF